MVNGNSKFSLLYEKDQNVYAPEGTLGIMVFKTKKDAERWILSWRETGVRWKIKRVIPIGRGSTPVEISAWALTEDLEDFYNSEYRLDKASLEPPLPGCICYPAVFVID
jgi:hypothetical protein